VWHDLLPGATIRSLHDALESFGGKSFTVGTACSGSDVVMVALSELSEFWAETFGTKISIRHVFSCESDVGKQNWIRRQFPDCESIISDTAHLSGDFAPLAGSSQLVKLQSVDLYIAGFICKSRARNNPNRAQNKHCVQTGEGLTGESFKSVVGFVERHRPRAALLENVDQLAEGETPGSAEGSDAEWITKFFKRIGYNCEYYHIVARLYGSFPRRDRLFWLALRSDVQKVVFDEFPKMLDTMATAHLRVKPSLDDFLLDESCRQCRIKEPADVAGKEFKYKDDHMRLYDSINLVWPAPSPRGYDGALDHMEQRAFEVFHFANNKFPLASGALTPEFIDVQPEITWVCGSDGKQNPWRTVFPTLTSCGQYIYRRWVLGVNYHFLEVGQLDGMELLQMIGFEMANVETWDFPSHELATSMAGNAFSAYAVGPMLILSMIGLGAPRSLTVNDGDDEVDEDAHMSGSGPEDELVIGDLS